MQPRCGRGAAEMQPRCSRDAAEVQPRCSRDAAEVRPRCSRDAAEMRPRCRDAAEVRPRWGRRLEVAVRDAGWAGHPKRSQRRGRKPAWDVEVLLQAVAWNVQCSRAQHLLPWMLEVRLRLGDHNAVRGERINLCLHAIHARLAA